jgi:hypothetical protein
MPFKQIQWNGWLLDVDVEATKRAYLDAPAIDLCCQDCQNYGALARAFSGDLLAFFEQFGIDPAKEAEVYTFWQNTAGLHYYGGFYHLVGSIRKRPEPLAYHNVTKQFQASFTEDVHLVPDDFPRPVLQMEIMAVLPRVLEEISTCEKTDIPFPMPGEP